jgi:hypothetical protein
MERLYSLFWSYLGFAEKVVCEERGQGTGNREHRNREQFQLSGYPQFPISDKEKCNCFETPFANTLHLLVIKIRETPINRRF